MPTTSEPPEGGAPVIGPVAASAAGTPANVRLRGSAWVLAAQVGKTALSIPLGILLARTLGASGKGAISVVQTAAAVAVAVLHFGLPSAVMWLAARGHASGRQTVAMGTALAGSSLVLGVLAVSVLGMDHIAARLGLQPPGLLVFAVLGLVPSMLGYFTDAWLVGRGRVRSTQIVDVSALVAQVAILAALALLHRLTPAAALVVWLVSTAAATFAKAGIVLADRSAGAAWSPGPLWTQGRAYGIQSWLGSTVNLLSLRQDVLILAAIAGTGAVGIYTIGVTAAELAWYVPNALQSVATAKFSAEEDSLELARRLNRSVWPVTLLLCLAILAGVAPLLPLVYGPAFRASILPLALLLPGILATSMSSSLAAWLAGRGYPGDPALANLVNMVVNVIANLALVPRLGAAGAALASSISYTAGAALILWRFTKRSGSTPAETLLPRRSDVTAIAAMMTAPFRNLRPVRMNGE